MGRLSKEQRKDIAALAAKKDSDIDLTDMPEVLDWSGAEVGRFFRKNEDWDSGSRWTEEKAGLIGVIARLLAPRGELSRERPVTEGGPYLGGAENPHPERRSPFDFAQD